MYMSSASSLKFLSTPSGWRATLSPCDVPLSAVCISIHALRVEGDTTPLGLSMATLYISIHALRVEGDLPGLPDVRMCPISIHALRVEGDHTVACVERAHNVEISIHALRVEGDVIIIVRWRQYFISIHALRVEGDCAAEDVDFAYGGFLSTPSGWRATNSHEAFPAVVRISIHALRVEGDSKNGQSFRLFLRKREKNLPL